jgi:hypothetical protein
VQAPVKFELVINPETAKTLGLTVQDRLLAFADEWLNEESNVYLVALRTLPVLLLRSLLILFALISAALAEDGPSIAAEAKDAANRLQDYLDGVAKAGGRPDFSQPPASELFGRVFDLKKLAALPPPTPQDVPWLMNWSAAASQSFKSIMYFGITPPAGTNDQAAMERNMSDFEDQEAVVADFMIRFTARQALTIYLFMEQLPPEQRTPMREEGFNTTRVGAGKVLYGALITIATGMKPANERRISAAMNDTRDIWVSTIFPKDRPQILTQLAHGQKALKDREAQKNLAAFRAALVAAK